MDCMKASQRQLSTAAALALLTAVPATAMAGGYSKDYAETLYAEFSEASNGLVGLSVTTRQVGKLEEIAQFKLSEVLSWPQYVMKADNDGLRVSNIDVGAPVRGSGQLVDHDSSRMEFGRAGFLVDGGVYRVLDVVLTTDKVEHRHEAIEFCFPAQEHCVVYDPSVEFIDSHVNNIRALKASG